MDEGGLHKKYGLCPLLGMRTNDGQGVKLERRGD